MIGGFYLYIIFPFLALPSHEESQKRENLALLSRFPPVRNWRKMFFKNLLNRYRFRQIPRFINITVAQISDMVSKKLQWNNT